MHAKYEVAISYCSKVITKVKVDNIQTGQKQYTPEYSVGGGGHKKSFGFNDSKSYTPR